MTKSFKYLLGQGLAMLVAVAPILSASSAEETNATPAHPDYQSFRIIYERNIFNPNRSSRSDYRSNIRREPERRTRSTAFGLIGTMSYEKGRYAFFDGTSSEYRKVLQAEESIAGYKIAEIGPNSVTLQGEGKEVHLEVGSRMKRQDGDWALSSNGESFESMTSETTSETPAAEGEKTATSSTTSAPAGEASDVLKRLMQKREQEMQNEKK
jgi:hypothetical protein